jgi:hypothetical protein
MTSLETMRKIRIDGELEVEVDKKWLGSIQTRLLNKVERSALLDKEIVMEMIDELRIFLILDQPTTLQGPHAAEGGILPVALSTLVVI